MTPEIPHFKIPLNLPHAGRVANRLNLYLSRHVDPEDLEHRGLILACNRLSFLLCPYLESGDNLPEDEGNRVAGKASALGRLIVEEIEHCDLGSDRVGQCVRNLFECLEKGQEGAMLSLRAGENPRSLGRPAANLSCL